MKQQNQKNRLVKAGHYVGMKFSGGWWFIQSVGTEYVELKPWILLNENGNRADIAAQTAGSEDDEIEDTLSNRILEPDDSDRNQVFQIMYGVSPSRMQVFSIFGRDRNVSIERYDQPGDPAAYVDGFSSPYDNPSEHSEVFYINSMEPLSLQAYNPMDTADEARISFHINKLRYTTITDRSVMKAFLQGQRPAKLVNMGLGVKNSDEVDVPNWVNEAFGEHIYTTSEILDSSDSGNGGVGSGVGVDLQSGAQLEQSGN